MSFPLKEYTVAKYAVDLVAALGSTRVFTLTGGMAMYLNKAVEQHPTMKAVYCQHEQACVAAAEGYSKATNFRRAGFAVVTAGPGVSNTVTSLISSYGDSTPLIVLAGQIKSADIDSFGTRTHGIQEIRSQQLITPCVKTFVRLDANTFRQQLQSTIISAFTGRPGPVFIEIPLDVQGLLIESSPAEIANKVELIRDQIEAFNMSSVDEANLCDPLLALISSSKPLLYIGNGIRIADQEQAIIHFAERHNIPMVFSWLSFDIIPGDHHLNFGSPGGLAPIYANHVLSSADTIVFLGARLDLGTTAFQRESFGSQASRWFIDVDSTELSKFAGLVNTRCIKANLRNLSNAIYRLNTHSSQADIRWIQSLCDQRADYRAEERSRLQSSTFNVYAVASALSAHADDKMVVSASSGYAEETFTRFFVPGVHTRFFNGAALGAMGMGLPNALGAAFGTTAPIMCMEADGGIMLNLQELSTLRHYAPPGFALFILNNHGYESIRSSQKRHFGKTFGADADSGLFIPDFEKVAQAFRLDYICINNLERLLSFLDAFDPSAPPKVVDLHIEKYEYRGPSVKTIIDADGIPSTTPLTEITW